MVKFTRLPAQEHTQVFLQGTAIGPVQPREFRLAQKELAIQVYLAADAHAPLDAFRQSRLWVYRVDRIILQIPADILRLLRRKREGKWPLLDLPHAIALKRRFNLRAGVRDSESRHFADNFSTLNFLRSRAKNIYLRPDFNNLQTV